MTRARIIFVPGLNPKPPPDTYRAQLLRVVTAGLNRSRPQSGQWLAEHPSAFVLVAWTYLFYGAHRDISLDLPGIERLLTQSGPSETDLQELDSWSRRLLRFAHLVGDAWPLAGRRLAPLNTRRVMHEANRYLKNRDGVGVAVRGVLRETLEASWREGAKVLLIGHSLGSVIAYDTLWELSHVYRAAGEISLFVTLGSPLATRFVQRSLLGVREQGAARYPHNVRRWVNLSASADLTALKPHLEPRFKEMVDLQLCDGIADVVGFHNYFRGATGLNPHEAYGYLWQPRFAELVGEWLA